MESSGVRDLLWPLSSAACCLLPRSLCANTHKPRPSQRRVFVEPAQSSNQLDHIEVDVHSSPPPPRPLHMLNPIRRRGTRRGRGATQHALGTRQGGSQVASLSHNLGNVIISWLSGIQRPFPGGETLVQMIPLHMSFIKHHPPPPPTPTRVLNNQPFHFY